MPTTLITSPSKISSGPPSVSFQTPVNPTVEARLREAVKAAPEIFFIEDVRLNGVPMQQVRFALTKMARESGGFVIRLAWGIYAKPALGENSKKAVFPSTERIAFACASKNRLEIIPSGQRAACRVGLIDGAVEDADEWFTSGTPKKIQLSNGKTIKFLMTREARMFAFKDDRMRDLSNGIRFVGKFNMGDYEMSAVKVWLKSISEENYLEDLELCPEWVRDILQECREKDD